MKKLTDSVPLVFTRKDYKKYFKNLRFIAMVFGLFSLGLITISCNQSSVSNNKPLTVSNTNSANLNTNSNANLANSNTNTVKSNANLAKYSPTPYRSTVEDDITSRRNAECIRQRTAAGLDTSPCAEWSEER